MVVEVQYIWKRGMLCLRLHMQPLISLSLLFSQAILIWSLITFAPPKYGKIEYPGWGSAVGWCMIIFCLIWIPIVAIYKISRSKGNLWQVSAAGGVRRRGCWQVAEGPQSPQETSKALNPTSSSFQRIVSCCKPRPTWGPYLECHRGERYKDMADPVKKEDVEIPTVDGYIRKLE